MSRLALERREAHDEQAIVLGEVSKKHSDALTHLAAVELENRHLAQLVHQQNALLRARFPVEDIDEVADPVS